MPDIDELFGRYAKVYCNEFFCEDHKLIDKDQFTKAIAELSIPLATEVKPDNGEIFWIHHHRKSEHPYTYIAVKEKPIVVDFINEEIFRVRRID